MTENVEKQIDLMVRHIQNASPVKSIILFGSTARGEAGKDSDIDLCVITEQTDVSRLDLTRRLRRAIAPVMTIPVDLFVYHQNEFDERGRNPAAFEYRIKKEGIALHES